jgi:hypothetical protein
VSQLKYKLTAICTLYGACIQKSVAVCVIEIDVVQMESVKHIVLDNYCILHHLTRYISEYTTLLSLFSSFILSDSHCFSLSADTLLHIWLCCIINKLQEVAARRCQINKDPTVCCLCYNGQHNKPQTPV